MDRACRKNDFGFTGIFKEFFRFFQSVLGALCGTGFVLVDEIDFVDPDEFAPAKQGKGFGRGLCLRKDAFDIVHPVGPPVDDFPGEIVREILCPLIKLS